MASINVHNEEPFKVPARTFTIGASSSGYQLKFATHLTSVDDTDTTAWTEIGDAVSSDECCEVCNGNPAQVYMLDGNSDDVVIVY